jgi:hypothetical protein
MYLFLLPVIHPVAGVLSLREDKIEVVRRERTVDLKQCHFLWNQDPEEDRAALTVKLTVDGLQRVDDGRSVLFVDLDTENVGSMLLPRRDAVIDKVLHQLRDSLFWWLRSKADDWPEHRYLGTSQEPSNCFAETRLVGELLLKLL